MIRKKNSQKKKNKIALSFIPSGHYQYNCHPTAFIRGTTTPVCFIINNDQKIKTLHQFSWPFLCQIWNDISYVKSEKTHKKVAYPLCLIAGMQLLSLYFVFRHKIYSTLLAYAVIFTTYFFIEQYWLQALFSL